QAGGGWDYKYGKSGRRDTSVAGWQIQALKAASIAGAENPSLRAALDKAMQDLKRVQEAETGRFFYTDAGSHKTDSITGVALLSLQLSGDSQSREARTALQALANSECDWKKPPAWPLYAWYYITQARFHQGGQGWDHWNRQFARAFVENQNTDGSWTSPGAIRENASGQEVNLGPVYSTSLAALTLQVYYRFLPTYKTISQPKESKRIHDDVVIEML
ncbi:MAG: hypothetical protein V2A34_12225, partial [Lentisphaerota bacterium]